MNIMKMMQQAASMKKQMKQMQKELARKKYEVTERGVTITVRGDFTVDAVQIDDSLIDTGKKAALEKAVTTAVAKAVKTAKDEAQAEMSKLAGGMGLGDLL